MPNYISIAVIALVAISFLVFLFKSIGRWHWLHITLLFCVFVTSIFSAVMVSRSFKTRTAWKQKYEEMKALSEENQRIADLITFGAPDQVRSGLDSVRGIAHALELELYGRGRAWSQATVEFQNPNYVLTIASLGAAAEPNQDNPLEKALGDALGPGRLVFVFREDSVQGVDNATAGALFLGAMTVVRRTGAELELEPTALLNHEIRELEFDANGDPRLDENGQPVVTSRPVFPGIADELANPSTTWSVYEIMPIDMRDTFKRVSGIDTNPQDENVDFDAYQQQYRQVLTEYMSASRFGFNLDDPADAARYEQIIDHFAFDMMRLNDINLWIQRNDASRLNKAFDPPAEEKYTRLRFNANSVDEYEVDTQAGNIRDIGAFDSSGRSAINLIKLGNDTGKTRLEKDAVIIVDAQVAARVQAREDVTDEGPVYVRNLDDFNALIGDYAYERRRLFDSLLLLVDELSQLQSTLTALQSQQRHRTNLIDVMTQDSQNLAKDQSDIIALAEQRAAEVQQLQQEIDAVYAAIIARYSEIKSRNETALETSGSR